MEVLRIVDNNKYHTADVVINCSNIMSMVLMKQSHAELAPLAYIYVGASDGYKQGGGVHYYTIYADSIVSTNSPVVAAMLSGYIKVDPIKVY